MEIIQLKAKLLELETISISPEIQKGSPEQWNLFHQPHIFIQLGDSSRVKIRVVKQAPLEIINREGKYDIELDGSLLLANIQIEEPIFHCPKQISVCYYYECSFACKYCPLPGQHGRTFPSKRDVIERIEKAGVENLQGVAITHGVPQGKLPEEIIIEIADTVKEIRHRFGNTLPIGVGPFPCEKEHLQHLFGAGATEARINLEVYNKNLFQMLCPRKNYDLTLKSIENAVNIFGFNKVSSSMIVGIGETDEDLFDGVKLISSLGAIPTLHPFDTFQGYETRFRNMSGIVFGRPPADRLISLAWSHKEYLVNYGLNPRLLKTTCPGCTACSLMPIVDF